MGQATFLSSGTWTCPAGVTAATIETWGGGGRGGVGDGGQTSGGGGGGGAYSKKTTFVSTPNTVYTVHVGIGGSDSGPADDTWFNSTSTIFAQAGTRGEDGVNGGTGGIGGAASAGIGDVKFSGGHGADGGFSAPGGGGGSSAGPGGNGNNASGQTGGSAVTGGGSGGAGNASPPGAGGAPGGGAGGNLAADQGPRGVGAAGKVVISWNDTLTPSPIKLGIKTPISPILNTNALRPLPVTLQAKIVTPHLAGVFPTNIAPPPLQAIMRIPRANYALPLVPLSLGARLPAPMITNVVTFSIPPLGMKINLPAPALSTPFDEYTTVDFLIQAPRLGLKLSYNWNPDTTWEHRLGVIEDFAINAPPGGGVAVVGNLSFTILDDGSGHSALNLWDNPYGLQGAPITLDMLLNGIATTRLFTGIIDTVIMADGVARVTCVDTSLANNLLLPQQLITTDLYPQADKGAINLAIPLVYGHGIDLPVIPTLLVDVDARTYIFAAHTMRVAAGLPVFIGTIDKDVNLVAFVPLATLPITWGQQHFVLNQALSELNWNTIVMTPTGGYQANVGVINPQFVTGANETSRTVITTQARNSNGMGYGVLYVPTAGGLASRNNNSVNLSILNHRPTVSAAPTVQATFSLLTWDPITLNVLQNDLWVSPPFTATMIPYQTVYNNILLSRTILGTGAALVLRCLVQKTDGPGTANDTYEIGEVSISSSIAMQNDTTFYLRSDALTGRDDLPGSPGVVLTYPNDIAQSFLVQEGSTEQVGLSVNSLNFSAGASFYTSINYHLDGGIGGHWAVARAPLRQLLDQLMQQSASVLWPDAQGQWHITPLLQPMSTAATFDTTNILGLEADPATLAPQRHSSLQITLGDPRRIFTRFELKYRYNPGIQVYERLLYVDPNGSNVPQSDNLIALLDQTRIQMGTQQTYTMEAYWIGADSVAEQLMRHLVSYFGVPRLWCSWDAPLASQLPTLGQTVRLHHPLIPLGERSNTFEIHAITVRPNAGRVHYEASAARLLRPQRIHPDPLRVATHPLAQAIQTVNNVPAGGGGGGGGVAGPSGLLTNLVAYWALDERSGTRRSRIGAGLSDLTPFGKMASAPGQIGLAASFDGVNDFLLAINSAQLTIGSASCSWCCWVNFVPTFHEMVFWAKGTSTSLAAQEWEFRCTAGSISFSVGNGTLAATVTQGGLIPNTWYFVQAWLNQATNEIGLRINQRIPVTQVWTGGSQTTNSLMTLGTRLYANVRYYQGLIDECGFWSNRVLTTTDFATLWNNGQGLTWPF